ncbi:MAG: peptide chain release factor-like protein, partial [Myxococcota bacterium]|nr:peptide chain release factor-like protein [Myxococcota bacterium]
QGRIHTSTVTVAVIPEIDDEISIDVIDSDLKIDTYRASGAGGQHVNRTDSAVRITHLPSGLVVQCQNERSQHANKASAMKELKSRLTAIEIEKQRASVASDRRSQVGTGDRSERIRTYNYPQSRVTDHRIGLTVHKLNQVIDGELDVVVDPLLAYQHAEALKELGQDT